MPPRRNFRRPPPRRTGPDRRDAGKISFERRSIPQPPNSITLRALGPAASGWGSDQWELICRDGWEWRASGPGQVAVRVATLNAEQAAVVEEWIDRIKDPAVWWAVSRELQSPDSDPSVAAALAAAPWLTAVLPVVLEASTEGSPPPPPAPAES